MSIYPEKTIKEVMDKLDARTVLGAVNYRTDTIQEIGDTIKCFCPIHKEQVFRTLILKPREKSYRCSYSLCPGNKGGDLISLYAMANGIEYDEGLAQLVKKLNISVDLPTTQEFIDKTVEVAENYLELGVLDDAEQGFSKVVDVQPNNIGAHKGLLEIYNIKKNESGIIKSLKTIVTLLISNGNFDDAMSYCSQLVEKAPESTEAHHLMVECFLGKEDYQSALGEYMNLADLYESVSNYDQALAVYHKIESLGLDIIDVYPHIINVLVASNRTDEAIQETLKRAENHRAAKAYDKTLECYKYILELDTSRNDIRKQFISLAIEVGLNEERIDESLKIIDDIIAQDALGEAAEALHALLEGASDNPKILSKIISVYFLQSRNDEAEALQLRLAEIYDNAGRFEEALAPINEILRRKPESTEALFQLALTHYRSGDQDKAIEAYRKIIDIHKKQNEIDKALAIYNQLIEIAPFDISFKEQQIELYRSAHRIDEAFDKTLILIEFLESRKENDKLIDKLRFALSMKPDAENLIIRLADILHRLKRFKDASDEYYRAYEVLRQKEKPDLAAAQIQRCLDINPDDRKALFGLGETYMLLGDQRKALQYFKKLAAILLDESLHEEAETVLKKIIEIQPDDINTLTQLADVYGNLGFENEVVSTYEKINRIYLEKEAFNKVIEICNQILKIRHENIAAHENLIFVYERTNRRAEAIELWFKLADIYQHSENHAKEEECYDAILKKDNGNVEARRRHIFLLLKLSQKMAAFKEARILSDQYTMRRQPELAIDLYKKLLETDPEELPLNIHLLELYKKTNQTAQIVPQIKRLITIYTQRDQMALVADYYSELIRFEPKNVEHRNYLIATLLQLDRKPEAMKQSQELAELHISEGRLEDAEAVFHNMLGIEPGNQDVYRRIISVNRQREAFDKAIEMIRTLASLQKSEGDIRSAIETLKEIFEIDSMNVENHKQIIALQKEINDTEGSVASYLSLYDILQNTGGMEEAVAVLQEAIDLKPDDPVLRRKMFNAHVQLGDIPRATEHLFYVCDLFAKDERFQDTLNTLAEILEVDPGNMQARKRRAETYALMGDEKKALAEFLKLSSDIDTGKVSVGTAAPRPAASFDFAMNELPIVEDYTFENFVVGAHNNFAYATAMAVAKAPAQNYNPLFLCSDVGLGKTHLIHAIANYIKKQKPDAKILYTNSEEFTTQLIDAIQNNTILQFRARHKNTDILLLDDVQFLAGKERAQEEFFHLFNTLFQAKKQIVITSDRPPKDIAHLEKRLKSRFGAGIVVDIQTPDVLTRAAILKKERDHMTDVEISDNILNAIAEKVDTNIRDLKGAFNQIVARHRITDQPITMDMVNRILDSIFEKV